MHDLGALPGFTYLCEGLGVNDSGQTVGFASTGTAQAAFIYRNGTMQTLNSLVDPSFFPWTFEEATGINDVGQIAAYGINSSGQTHAFLLTPTPEPSTLALLGIGAVSLLACAWRRRKLHNLSSMILAAMVVVLPR